MKRFLFTAALLTAAVLTGLPNAQAGGRFCGFVRNTVHTVTHPFAGHGGCGQAQQSQGCSGCGGQAAAMPTQYASPPVVTMPQVGVVYQTSYTGQGVVIDSTPYPPIRLSMPVPMCVGGNCGGR